MNPFGLAERDDEAFGRTAVELVERQIKLGQRFVPTACWRSRPALSKTSRARPLGHRG